MHAARNLFASYAGSSPTVRSRSDAHRPLPCVFFLPLRSSIAHSYGIRSLPVTSPPPLLRRMATEHSGAPSGNLTELNTASDFDSLVTPEGYISICGFGSLLSGNLTAPSSSSSSSSSLSLARNPSSPISINASLLLLERSARSTFPDLKNFRIGVLRGFRRVFAHVAPIFFERRIANEETGEVSSLSVEPCEGEFLIVTVFEIRKEEVPAFIERENEFRFLSVVPEGLDGTTFPNPAVVCARYSDEEFFQIRCQGSKEIYYQRYGRYNIHKIWRDDILPCRTYLRHCVLAAKNLGKAAYDNFLDHTYVADRKTTIRQYLASAGSGIMEEEPPESLKSRYGG
ncbi:hypothetical protein ACMD2_01756 [Ananas comosus]|uniref:Uncharacterized protein n=1 Tax=Ananas comosus TaxID=4615 RepID=A0A199VKA8_ANACO|nr:hypothetical protein ACMD2_01756 [Ananas comosus]